MSKHTPEPWGEYQHAREPRSINGWVMAILRDMSDADYDHARSCVNALAGIDDPAAFVARAKRIEDAARDLIGCWQDDTSPLTNPIERLMTALETNP
jgi:hypothetical protein